MMTSKACAVIGDIEVAGAAVAARAHGHLTRAKLQAAVSQPVGDHEGRGKVSSAQNAGVFCENVAAHVLGGGRRRASGKSKRTAETRRDQQPVDEIPSRDRGRRAPGVDVRTLQAQVLPPKVWRRSSRFRPSPTGVPWPERMKAETQSRLPHSLGFRNSRGLPGERSDPGRQSARRVHSSRPEAHNPLALKYFNRVQTAACCSSSIAFGSRCAKRISDGFLRSMGAATG